MTYYHGKPHPYPYAIHVTDLFENLNDTEKEHIFKPVLIDLSTYDDQALKQHGSMAPVDILLKHIFDSQSQDNLKLILSELAKANHKIRYYSIQYMMKRVNLPEQEFIELALQYLDEEDVMTVEEQIEQRVDNEQGMLLYELC